MKRKWKNVGILHCMVLILLLAVSPVFAGVTGSSSGNAGAKRCSGWITLDPDQQRLGVTSYRLLVEDESTIIAYLRELDGTDAGYIRFTKEPGYRSILRFALGARTVSVVEDGVDGTITIDDGSGRVGVLHATTNGWKGDSLSEWLMERYQDHRELASAIGGEGNGVLNIFSLVGSQSQSDSYDGVPCNGSLHIETRWGSSPRSSCDNARSAVNHDCWNDYCTGCCEVWDEGAFPDGLFWYCTAHGRSCGFGSGSGSWGGSGSGSENGYLGKAPGPSNPFQGIFLHLGFASFGLLLLGVKKRGEENGKEGLDEQ